jgi:very-short-patch-repair endonuclease
MVGGEGMAVLEAVRVEGGVMRSTALIARGHTHRTIRALVDADLLTRVRRVWLALPDADPLALAAAREGVVISCITQARRLGLWVLGNGAPHVAAPPHGPTPRVAAGTVVHWAVPVVPRHPGLLFDTVENVLALAIACQPEEHARAIVESALRQGIVDRSALLRLPFDAAARAMIESASPWSDSGLETFFVPRLRWLRVPITTQTWIAGHRVDALIGERLVVQIDGGHHVGAQRDADIAHDAALMLMGYHVIRVSYTQVVHRWHEVQDRVMRAVAQGLHLAR